jgi:hypothetical protein
MKTTMSKALQYKGDKAVDLHATPKLFDGLIEQYREYCDYLEYSKNEASQQPTNE